MHNILTCVMVKTPNFLNVHVSAKTKITYVCFYVPDVETYIRQLLPYLCQCYLVYAPNPYSYMRWIQLDVTHTGGY